MEAKRTFDSPLITSLQQALACGNTAALETFWNGMTKHGGPLIEANVVVRGGPTGLDHPANNQMTRLLNTNLWYKT
jgi:enterochelin esterase family protein